jgi:hypothetical protein
MKIRSFVTEIAVKRSHRQKISFENVLSLARLNPKRFPTKKKLFAVLKIFFITKKILKKRKLSSF